MSETPVERQTVRDDQCGEPAGAVAADSPPPGSRSLHAGGEFLQALAADLGVVAARLRLWLVMRQRRPLPPAPAPRPASLGSAAGRVLRRLGILLFGLVSVGAGALAAVLLWVLFGLPGGPRHVDPNTAGLRAEAATSPSPPRNGAPKAAAPSPPSVGREVEAPIRPGACAGGEPWLCPPGASSSGPGGPEKAATEAPTGAGADARAGVETQDRSPATPAAGPQEFAGTFTDPPRMQCSADLCAAKYRSFNAADCTYQPYGGGPRSICEMSTWSDAALPQSSRAATGPNTGAEDTRLAAAMPEASDSAIPARAGAQCNIALCAATHRTFNAGDCTYQPYGGGPRRLCEP